MSGVYHSTLIYNKLCNGAYKIVFDFSCFVNNKFKKKNPHFIGVEFCPNR